MRIAMVGTGYVGLVSGTCLATGGHKVSCLDVDARKVETLRRGILPIHEPGLSKLVDEAIAAGRLDFTTSASEALKDAQVVFLAVGTPEAPDGSADLAAIWGAVDSIAPHLEPDAILVIKSTVPVGTNRRVSERLQDRVNRPVAVVSNPEFLREGQAVRDFQEPDRVVVGADDNAAMETICQVYRKFLPAETPIVTMGLESSEMTKYVANCLLATKISFINEMANLCEHVGADIRAVKEGLRHDVRIGDKFLSPGVGYGGSCFPKDIRAMKHLADGVGLPAVMIRAADYANRAQKRILYEKIRRHFLNDLGSKTIAIWGLAFKPGTDDLREAPAIELVAQLLADGAQLRVYDPVAMPAAQLTLKNTVTYCESPLLAAQGAHAVVLVTEWPEFQEVPLDMLQGLLKTPTFFDGRNALPAENLRAAGFEYYGIGIP